MPVCEGSVLFGIGAAPLAVPLDRCVPVPEFCILSRTSGFGISPGFRLFSVVPGSWVFSGPVPVLVPVLVDSLAELLKVLVKNCVGSDVVFVEFQNLISNGLKVLMSLDSEISGPQQTHSVGCCRATSKSDTCSQVGDLRLNCLVLSGLKD